MPDRDEMDRFVRAVFRHADGDSFISLRAFYHAPKNGVAYGPRGVFMGQSGEAVLAAALAAAEHVANLPDPAVFCPPPVVLKHPHAATGKDIHLGLVLAVECDTAPRAALAQLQCLLGVRPTLVVASGGVWIDPETGEAQDKLHLYWRLTEPTATPEDHERLNAGRKLAASLTGADPSGAPAVHPMRWPGSWHTKGEPRLCRILEETEHELELGDALERLRGAVEAAKASGGSSGVGEQAKGSTGPGNREAEETAELVRQVMTAESYHGPLTRLAMRCLVAGAGDGFVVNVLRGIMLAVPDKGDPDRWQARHDDIPRAVSSAREKLGAGKASCDNVDIPDSWPEPVDFIGNVEATGAPELRPDHLPEAIAGFVYDVAERLGIDPAAVALPALVSLSAVMDDRWALQPKRRDEGWTERPCIWGVLVADPSVKKSPVLALSTKPVQELEAELRLKLQDEMDGF